MPQDIVSFYLQLRVDKSIDQFITYNNQYNRQKLEKLNVIDFIRYGLINGLIRRVHEYPLVNLEILAQKQIFNVTNVSQIKGR